MRLRFVLMAAVASSSSLALAQFSNFTPLTSSAGPIPIGSPLEAIDSGVTIETRFLSRVDKAPEVRLVVRVVTFLEKGTGTDPVSREWKNPRYGAELAKAGGRR